MDKLQQANALKTQIDQLQREFEMHTRVMANFLTTPQVVPKVGIQSAYSTSNVLWLQERYLPFKANSIMEAYLKNMAEHKAVLQTELDSLLK